MNMLVESIERYYWLLIYEKRSVNGSMGTTTDSAESSPLRNRTRSSLSPWSSFKHKKKSVNRCNVLEDYYELERPTRWHYPNVQRGEGPVHYGYENPFCTDCKGCYHRQRLLDIIYYNDQVTITNDVSSTSSNGRWSMSQTYLEYLAVEFARDVEMPSIKTKTTQETVALYLQTQQKQRIIDDQNSATSTKDDVKEQTVCVVNAGLHDMAIGEQVRVKVNAELGSYSDHQPIPTATYVNNVLTYLDLLGGEGGACGTIVWIMMTATLDQEDYPQRNAVISRWNNVLNSTIHRRQRKFLNDSHKSSNDYKILRLDPFVTSKTIPHIDNVHLDRSEYYEPLAGLFASFISPLPSKDGS